MAKRTMVESIDKLKEMVEGNNGISISLQNKILKQITCVSKSIKVPTVKEKKLAGSSQFEKKMRISAEMAKFAKWDPASLHSRVEITKVIWDYIKINGLRDETNKRIVTHLTPELEKLLDIKNGQETLSYPKLQKYIGRHLIKE